MRKLPWLNHRWLSWSDSCPGLASLMYQCVSGCEPSGWMPREASFTTSHSVGVRCIPEAEAAKSTHPVFSRAHPFQRQRTSRQRTSRQRMSSWRGCSHGCSIMASRYSPRLILGLLRVVVMTYPQTNKQQLM